MTEFFHDFTIMAPTPSMSRQTVGPQAVASAVGFNPNVPFRRGSQCEPFVLDAVGCIFVDCFVLLAVHAWAWVFPGGGCTPCVVVAWRVRVFFVTYDACSVHSSLRKVTARGAGNGMRYVLVLGFVCFVRNPQYCR